MYSGGLFWLVSYTRLLQWSPVEVKNRCESGYKTAAPGGVTLSSHSFVRCSSRFCDQLASASFPSPSEGDWMSIFGHLAAPVNGLCLITLCLLSAGLADGYNSFLSPQLPLIYVEPVHTDATGQLVSDLYFVQLDAPTTYDGNSH